MPAGIGFFNNYKIDKYFKAVRADGGTTTESIARAAWSSIPALAKQKGSLFFMPGCYKTSTLYFMDANGGFVTASYARTGTAMYIDSTGKYASAAANTPRFEYDPNTLAFCGYIGEATKTNLCSNSNTFNTTPWTNTGSNLTLTSGQTNPLTAAGNDMWKLARISTGAAASLTMTFSATSGTPNSISIHCKAGAVGGKFGLKIKGGSTRVTDLVVDLSTGNVDQLSATGFTAQASDVRNMGNGVWRISLMATAATTETVTAYVGPTNLTTTAWEGTNTVNSEAYVYGFQAETGDMSSYIPTSGATAVRNFDDVSISSMGAWFTATEGTVYYEAAPTTPPSTLASNAIITYRVSSDNNNRIYTDLTSTKMRIAELKASVQQTDVSVTTSLPTVRQNYKLAWGFKASDWGISLNGASAVTNTSNTLPTGTLSWMRFCCDDFSTTTLATYLKAYAHIPSKLTSADLATLST